MQCIPTLTLGTDQPFWVTRESFYQHFDQADFRCRESQQISLSYLASWFFAKSDGSLHFMLPTVRFVAGKTQFINGRHRAAVLLHHLDEIPLAFAFNVLSDSSVFYCLDKRPLNITTTIELPDLPVAERLP